MKKHIVKALKWALSKFEKPQEEIAAWPFPVGRLTKDFSVEPCEKPKKHTLKKATTRAKKPAVKKPIKKGK